MNDLQMFDEIQVAKLLCIRAKRPKRVIQRLARAGVLKGVKLSDRLGWRFTPEAIQNFQWGKK